MPSSSTASWTCATDAEAIGFAFHERRWAVTPLRSRTSAMAADGAGGTASRHPANASATQAGARPRVEETSWPSFT